MKRAAGIAAILLLVTVPAHAGFDEVVRAVQMESGIRPVRIPFLGLARLVVWAVKPAGVHDVQVASFEGRGADRDGHGPANLESILRKRAGAGFQPLVRAHSRRRNEWTFIYARPDGENRLELIVATRDGAETTVVRAVVNPDKMLRHLHGPDSVVKVARQ